MGGDASAAPGIRSSLDLAPFAGAARRLQGDWIFGGAGPAGPEERSK
jgi:hypothetical protein